MMAYTAAVMAAGRAASWHLALQARRFFSSNSIPVTTVPSSSKTKKKIFVLLDLGSWFLDVFFGVFSDFCGWKWINLMIK